jgi:HK97 family phage major capsid protein
MTIKELQARYASLLQQAKDLAKPFEAKEDGEEPEEMPQEVAEKIDALLGESDKVKLQIKRAERVADGEKFMAESAGTQAAHLEGSAQTDWRPAGPSEGMQEIDIKAWHEIEVPRAYVDPVYGIVNVINQKVRFHIPLAVQESKDYQPAFESYLRKDFADMGPNDRKTLSEGVDSAGGFLVPPDYHVELIKKIATMATIRPNARVVQTSRDIAQWPRVIYTADDEYTSGVRLTWTGETPASATSHRVSDPVFGLYQIPVHTAMASMPVTNTLLEDSAFDIFGVSQDLIAEAFSLGENDAFINGDGVSRPMGILTEAGTANGPATVNSGDANLMTADGVIDLAYALPAQYERNAKFLFNKQTEKAIRQLKDAVDGNYLWPIVAGVGNFGPAPRTLLEFPVMRDEFMPDVAASAYPALFGDFTGYLVLDRVGLSIQRLSELYAETNITLLLARKRVGGQLVQPWRLKAQVISA